MARDGDLDLPSSISGSADDDERAWRLELAALRERAEGAAEGILPREDIDGVAAVEAAWADEAVAVDRQLRALALEIARRDVELGELAGYSDVYLRDRWRRVGILGRDRVEARS